MTIGARIKGLRLESGCTQAQLGEITGLGAKYISALERGVQKSGTNAIEKLCDAFTVDEITLRFGVQDDPAMKGWTMWDRMAWEAWQKLPEASKKELLPSILAAVPVEAEGPTVQTLHAEPKQIG